MDDVERIGGLRINELRSMPANGDKEILHARADQILLDVLTLYGTCAEAIVAEEYRQARQRVGFWYA